MENSREERIAGQVGHVVLSMSSPVQKKLWAIHHDELTTVRTLSVNIFFEPLSHIILNIARITSYVPDNLAHRFCFRNSQKRCEA